MAKILIADDDRATRQILRQALVDAGFSVSLASDGRAALRHLRKAKFDFMLLDVWMPGLNGLELLAQIRGIASPPRVVVMTSDRTPETLLRAVQEQAFRFIAERIRAARPALETEVQAGIMEFFARAGLVTDHAPIVAVDSHAASRIDLTADRERLRLALANFISNAIKFTESGSVTVRIEPRGDRIALIIADSGIGMPLSVRQRLFEKFYKADPNMPGSGIGLALSKAIIDKHGGTIEVDSQEGRGTTITVWLKTAG